MRRDDVFKNVSFGGAWSERILGVEKRQQSLDALRRAVIDCVDEDLRGDAALIDALAGATAGIPKAHILRDAWLKALNIELASHRQRELKRLHGLIEAAIGTAAQI